MSGLGICIKSAKRVDEVTPIQLKEIDNLVAELNPKEPFTEVELKNIPFGVEFADTIHLEGEYYPLYSIFREVLHLKNASQIHSWFAKNLDNYKDDCKIYEVTKDQLEKLLAVVNKVLDDNSLADQLLPTEGSYNKKYFKDLEKIKQNLEVLKTINLEKQVIILEISCEDEI